MKEHPILFSTEMLQAILRGEKTQTRRVVKVLPKSGFARDFYRGNYWTIMPAQKGGYVAIDIPENTLRPEDKIRFTDCEGFPCPYGKIGDQLWVRESFLPNYFDDNKPAYKADWTGTAEEIINSPKWKPSIHMPRNLSRIQLEILNIKVERVQDITEEDAMKEGMQIPVTEIEGKIKPIVQVSGKYLPLHYGDPYKYKSHYAALWDGLNFKRGYGWSVNPFVWCIEFKRIK
ncbi:MAG: hypothetical protein RDU14_16935 [Melioribacteraceae bacterium]|nr:hypothetical protein [Melioribacteraceae bacterium]